MKKKLVIGFIGLLLILTMSFCLTGCEYTTFTGNAWKKKFDISAPDLNGAGNGKETANSSGWYATMIENFEGNSWRETWRPIENYLRNEEYWCDKMISQNGDKIDILAEECTNHNQKYNCINCDGKSNYYTSGLFTANVVDGVRVPTFEQAFGYYEARVQFPKSDGMWSAFWLHTVNQGRIGDGGVDGAEIDIYESSFWKKKNYVGHCIHYDGYGKEHRGGQATQNVGYDLYEGYHTFALKWTPNEYVFYVDGEAVWATDFGGICRVPLVVVFTNEIRQKAKYGPYGQRLGKFTGGTFSIDYVKIYQNVNYLPYIMSPNDFK